MNTHAVDLPLGWCRVCGPPCRRPVHHRSDACKQGHHEGGPLRGCQRFVGPYDTYNCDCPCHDHWYGCPCEEAMITADDLRATAEDVRNKANGATTHDGGVLGLHWSNEPDPDLSQRHAIVSRDEGTMIASNLSRWTAAHVAAWGPAAAIAVADWLERCAERAGHTSYARLEHDPEERDWYDPAEAFVRAWRGERR